jgi:hypothetical protein
VGLSGNLPRKPGAAENGTVIAQCCDNNTYTVANGVKAVLGHAAPRWFEQQVSRLSHAAANHVEVDIQHHRHCGDSRPQGVASLLKYLAGNWVAFSSEAGNIAASQWLC